MTRNFDKKSKKENLNKAYDNTEFLHSSDGRVIRIISEYSYPEKDLRRKGVRGTIVFYGSARTLSREKYNAKLAEINNSISHANPSTMAHLKKELEMLKSNEDLTIYYEDGVKLSGMLAKWLKENPNTKGIYIASGGGGGMMEAANRGAHHENTNSIGFNISLPFEQNPNHFISPDFNYEFHYFFMRKFWFVYLAKAIVTMPGGFGTLDEIMEILTLKQTLKVSKPLPVVLYGAKFWKNAINLEYLVEKRMISEKDLSLFKICDTPKEAFDFIKKEIEKKDRKRDTLLSMK